MNVYRAAGVLLPIFSLPGPFSIGCFGSEAVDFSQSLRRMGFSYRQILPINPPATGNSPYGSLIIRSVFRSSFRR